jgi:hypothetical protein
VTRANSLATWGFSSQATIAAYVGGFDRYKRQCDAIAAKGYEGFKLSKQKTGVA